MRSTIKDIQRLTGLSLSTISKYLNGGNVLPENKTSIDSAVRKLDFKVNQFARSLKTNKSNTVGVLIPELNSTFNTSIIAYTEDILRKHGYGVIVCDSRISREGEKQALAFLLSKKVDGIITIPFDQSGKHLLRAKQEGVPVVLIDRPVKDFNADAVLINNRGAAYEAVTEIIRKNHRRIAVIAGSQNIYTMRERLAGYREALAESGLDFNGQFVAEEEMSVAGGYRAFKKLISLKEPPSALFTVNYEFTLGSIIAMNELDIKLGEDISLIGFDNMELARVIKPRLSIVVQPIEEMAASAAELMLRRLNGEEGASPKVITLIAQLEKGSSVKMLEARTC